MNFFEALSYNPLLLYAVAAGLLGSIVSGIIGSYVVVKRIVFISGGIAHSVLGGIGFSIWLTQTYQVPWLTPLHGAIVAAVISALVIGSIRIQSRDREDTAIAAIWSMGMAMGIIFISQTPGFASEMSNYLIGNILWVSKQDLWLLTFLDVIVVIIAALFHKKFLQICFDEQQAKLQGVQVNSLYLLLLVLISLSIVLLIQVVGIVLVMTMLTLPAALANVFTKRLSFMMVIAILFSSFFCLSGTVLSYHLDWPTGATIALLAGGTYATVIGWKKKRSFRRA